MLNVNSGTVWSATPTPFLQDGALDVESLDKLVNQHLRLGVTGLFVAGTCGEGPLMPDAHRVELVRIVKRLSGARLHIAAQVSDTSAARVCVNISRMQDAGADSVVIAAPWITRFCNREFVRRYFLEAIEAATAPVGIYALPQPAESAIDLGLWTELAAHPKVRLVKDSTASAEYARAFVEVRKRRPDVRLLTGYEFDVISTIAAGYDGALVGAGILTGGMIRRVVGSLAAGDRAGAEAWQKRANEFLWELYRRDVSVWLGGIKCALVRMGIFRTEFMHMCMPLSPADRSRIDAAVERERAFIEPGHA